MTIKELKELALYAAKNEAPANYSVESVDAALADGFRELAGSVNQFMKNRFDIYEIIVETVDEIVPAKVIDAIGMFAEVRTVGQGQKAVFKQKIGKTRARKFLTQVGLSGVYETFRLDVKNFEVTPHAIGGATTIDFERMLDGSEVMADLMEVITEGMVDSVYLEVHKALKAAVDAVGNTSTTNKVVANKFNGDDMFNLVRVVRSYGNGAVIFAPPEFIAAMGPDAIVPVPASGNYGGVYHPQDIDAIHNQGYINIFRGTPIVMMPNNFTDESNTKTWLSPQIAYVLPTGGDKVVKVVLEGNTQIYDFQNRDQSMEIHTYRKLGAAILAEHNWGAYKNTGITDTQDNPYGF